MAPSARQLARDVLVRVETDRAWVNPTLDSALGSSRLDERDRAFASLLVYGTVRMQRACDHLWSVHVSREVDPVVLSLLRLGTFQLKFAGTPAHAAVSTTVELAPKRSRGFVNAVLRKVDESPVEFPDEATRLSYPDWLVERLSGELGRDEAVAALESMNSGGAAPVREDGYAQDLASRWVVEALDPRPGELVLDLCAAPGGKAALIASAGADVVANELHPHRARAMARLTGSTDVLPVVGDGTRPGCRRAFHRVLVDAPCSGVGSLRRRPDARWHLDPRDPPRLAELQKQLVAAALGLTRPGGVVVYSVCTVLSAETSEVDDWMRSAHPEVATGEPDRSLWRPLGRGGLVLPQDHDTDGMAVFVYRVPG